MSETAVVTGAARGLGLETCRVLLERGYRVFACPRKSSAELEALARASGDRLEVVPMDVGDDASVAAAARRIGERAAHVDVLFNNAGVYPEDGDLETLELPTLAHAFQVNTLGPLRTVRALLPLLRRGRGKRLVQITSLMGSNGDNTSGGSWAYRISKAALNMANTNLAHALGPEGFVALAVHPGWVRTRMGGAAAPLEPRGATEEVVRIALESGPADNGAFKGPGGATLPF